MVFNGLSHSELVVFNALREHDLPAPVSISKLAFLTGYHNRTIERALTKLEDCQVINRRRDRHGQPYTIEIVDNYAFPRS